MLKVDVVWNGIIPHISVNIADANSLLLHFIDMIACFVIYCVLSSDVQFVKIMV